MQVDPRSLTNINFCRAHQKTAPSLYATSEQAGKHCVHPVCTVSRKLTTLVMYTHPMDYSVSFDKE